MVEDEVKLASLIRRGLREEGLLETADLPTLLSRLAARHPVKLHFFSGHWMDVDTLADLAAARNFT